MNVLFFSLGSNIENRFQFLKIAVGLIEKKLGAIISFSKIYETPAWGFISTPFLNACIKVETKYTTKKALEILQAIEKEMGRTPKIGTTYKARPIDLDILYASEGIFNYSYLVVPHPLLQERKFVLQPLQDIAPKHIHPLLHKTTTELLIECKDDSEIKVTQLNF